MIYVLLQDPWSRVEIKYNLKLGRNIPSNLFISKDFISLKSLNFLEDLVKSKICI